MISRPQLQFCQALAALSERRRAPWWVTIDQVADRLGLEPDHAVLLAAECAELGLVMHDLSSSATRHRHETAIPHSVCLAAGWWLLAPAVKRAASAAGLRAAAARSAALAHLHRRGKRRPRPAR